jgi:hypothetical protein
MIDKAASENKSIIFVSDDQKEDWVSLYANKSMGPLPELIKEFNELTNNDFYIFKTFDFIDYAYKKMNVVIKDSTVKEIKNIAVDKIDFYSSNSYKYYLIEFSIDYKNSEDNLSKFYNIIQNKGYHLETKKNVSYKQEISLKVPFEDLVRRFYNLLTDLASELDFEILNFESKLLNQ